MPHNLCLLELPNRHFASQVSELIRDFIETSNIIQILDSTSRGLLHFLSEESPPSALNRCSNSHCTAIVRSPVNSPHNLTDHDQMVPMGTAAQVRRDRSFI